MEFVTTLKTERARVVVEARDTAGERDTIEDKVDSVTSWTTTTTGFATITKVGIAREEVEAQDTEEVKAELPDFRMQQNSYQSYTPKL